jgi:thymidylate synthase
LFNVVIDTIAVENLPIGNGFSKKFAIAELMAYCAGWDDVAWLARFNKNIAQFSDDGLSFYGAYGPRIAAHLQPLLTLLTEDPETRQAVCQIYDPADLMAVTKDKPCNTMFQLQSTTNVNGTVELHMTIYQRSCDLVWGLPHDHFSFSTLLILFAHQLGMRPGRVTRMIANAHVYEPEAGYANLARLNRAMEKQQTGYWAPKPNSLLAFRETSMIARYYIEHADQKKFDALTPEEFTPEAQQLVTALGITIVIDESRKVKKP